MQRLQNICWLITLYRIQLKWWDTAFHYLNNIAETKQQVWTSAFLLP